MLRKNDSSIGEAARLGLSIIIEVREETASSSSTLLGGNCWHVEPVDGEGTCSQSVLTTMDGALLGFSSFSEVHDFALLYSPPDNNDE